MITRLTHPLKREISVAGEPWVLTLDEQGLKLTRKGHRRGHELGWQALVSGDAALAAALNASLAQASSGRSRRPTDGSRKKASAVKAPKARRKQKSSPQPRATKERPDNVVAFRPGDRKR